MSGIVKLKDSTSSVHLVGLQIAQLCCQKEEEEAAAAAAQL
jgi:hypothetical protein